MTEGFGSNVPGNQPRQDPPLGGTGGGGFGSTGGLPGVGAAGGGAMGDIPNPPTGGAGGGGMAGGPGAPGGGGAGLGGGLGGDFGNTGTTGAGGGDIPGGVVKVIELVGSSPNSFSDAVRNAVRVASQSLRGIRGVEVISSNADVDENGNLTLYKVNCKVAFVIDR